MSWNAASPDERQAVARTIAKRLPDSFIFDGLETHSLGDQSHEIAFFHFEKAKFALVPGCSAAVLGYDRDRPFVLNPEQREDWLLTEEEYGISLHQYLDRYLTRLRTVQIQPLLVEVDACSVVYAQDGNDQTEGYTQVLSQLENGFRLLKPDEWEYVCSAGTRSLFRWGNDCPVSNSYEEKTWNQHKQPNAFGLRFNSSTYESELCQGPSLRGGDGGSSVCGGMGNVASWLPLASSFRVPDDEIEGWYIDDVLVRRVCSIFSQLSIG